VKTRIKHPQLDDEFATNLQIAMLKDTIMCLREIAKECVPILSFFPEEDQLLLDKRILKPLKMLDPEIMDHFQIKSQNGSDIEQRFSGIFSFAFNELELDSVLIIGSDTPHLQPSLIMHCITILQNNPKAAVLGPSQQGGFYLLGHTRPFIPTIGSIFQSYNELGNAMYLLTHENKLVHILPEVTDVDTFSDLNTVRTIIKLLSYQSSQMLNYYIPRYTNKTLDLLNESLWKPM
jgi:glycosyltransferase A (GT-A) superfamily protein (DUF2064 family)